MKFLPDPQKQGEIHFLFAKRLPYKRRLIFIVLFMIAGILLQFLVSFWFGLIFLVLGNSLSFIKGYSAKPGVCGKEKWNQVTPDEYRKVKEKQKQLKNWDLDMFDISNVMGGLFFVITAILCGTVYAYLYFTISPMAAVYWAIDCILIIVPHWFTGTKTFLKKDRLIIKIDLLEKIMQFLSSPSDIQVLPMLSTKKTKDKGHVPMDARLMIKILNAPAYFLGIQVQVCLNNVQGKYYPYLYCVIITKKEKNAIGKLMDGIKPVKGILFETKRADDVDVLVIRQYTTKTSGYYTEPKKCKTIVQIAVDTARLLVQEK